MSQKQDKPPLWVITFDYDSLEGTSIANFKNMPEFPLINRRIRNKGGDSFQEIQKIWKRMKEGYRVYTDKNIGENFRQKLKITRANIELFTKILLIYLDLIDKMRPPLEEGENGLKF